MEGKESGVIPGNYDRGVWAYDVETLINFFCAVFINIDTNENKYFIISDTINQSKELRLFINSKCKGLIGYNNLNFDYPVIHEILTKNVRVYDIYKKAQEIINEESDHLKEKDHLVKQLDLYKIWHFDNKAKVTSLKWIQYSTDFNNIEDMPINHNQLVTEDQHNDIISYCINDVLSTIELYRYTIGNTDHNLYKGLDKVSLRKDIIKEFNLPCINWNDVKIGDSLVKKDYLERTKLKYWDLKEIKTNLKPVFTYGECFPDYWKFHTKEFNNFINSFKDKIVDLDNKEEFLFHYNQTSYTFAQGGLHSNDSKRIIIPNSNQEFRDADVGLSHWLN